MNARTGSGEAGGSDQVVARLSALAAAIEGLTPFLDALLQETQLAFSATGSAAYLAADSGLELAARRGSCPDGEWPTRLPLQPPDALETALRTSALAQGQHARLLAAPLSGGGALAGALLLGFSPRGPLSPSELDRLKVVSDIAGTAFALHRAHQREDSLHEQILQVIEAGRAISERLGIVPEPHLRAVVQRGFQVWPFARDRKLPQFFQSVLQEIVEQARQAVGAQIGALGIGEDPSWPFSPWVFAGVPAEQAAAVGRYPRPVGTLGLVARQGEVVRVKDVRKHPRYRGLPEHHPEVSSLLGVPVRYRGASLGNLYMANKRGAAEFTLEDQRVLEMLATQAGLAVQQVCLRAMIDVQLAQLQIILDSAPHGILFLDATTGQVMANPRAMKIFGRPLVPEAGRAQYVSQLRSSDGRELSADQLPGAAGLRGQTVEAAELLVIQPEGRQVPILMSSCPVRDLTNEVVGAVVIFEDISALKQLDRMREEFTALVTHDLRSPIQTILLHSRALLSHASGKELSAPVSAIRSIERSAQNLSRLADDLLDAHGLETGRLAIAPTALAVSELVSGLMERLLPSLGEHPIRIAVADALPKVNADPLRLEQILSNLLENAAQYSADGRPIGVRASFQAGGVEISVQDQGVGIAPDELPRLFERGWRAKRRTPSHGLGLGLYIARGLAEAHGGRLWAESQPGRGSTFHLWLPALLEESALEHHP